MSDEQRRKISVAEKGKIVSPETRAKMSLSATGPMSHRWKGGPVVKNRRKNAKRRELGFIPLNEPFDGCEAHHVDPEHILYIPKKLHHSIWHNVWTGRNMETINKLAYEWLKENGI